MADYFIDGTVTASAGLSGDVVAATVVTGSVTSVAVLPGNVGQTLNRVITATAVLTGGWRIDAVVQGVVSVGANLLAVLSNVPAIQGSVNAQANVLGVLRVDAGTVDPLDAGVRRVCPDARLFGRLRVTRALVPSARSALNEKRTVPVMGLIVHSVEAYNLSDVQQAQVATGEFFLVGLLPFGGGFKKALAQPGDIGQRTDDGFLFRRPEPDEVVWFVSKAEGDKGLYKWNGQRWEPFKTTTERTLSVAPLYPAADPDGVLAYVGRLMGFFLVGLLRDANAIREYYDIFRTPDRLLAYYAGSVGIQLETDDPESERRVLRGAILTLKRVGLPGSITIALRHQGIDGYGREVWVDPNDPGNWQTRAELISQRPDVFAEINSRCGNREPRDDEATKGTTLLSRPHQPTSTLSGPYVPSSGMGIHINYANGGRIDMAASGMRDFIEVLVARLQRQTLPAASFVRYVCTDADSPEPLGVEETVQPATVSGVPWRVFGVVRSRARTSGRLRVASLVSGNVPVVVVVSGIVTQAIQGTINANSNVVGNWHITMTGKVQATAILTGTLE